MVSTKLTKIIFGTALTAIIAAVLLVAPTNAVILDSKLTEAQRGSISQNCATIKQSLRSLQKTDIRTRTYLGTTYETLWGKFILPMNHRLLENNITPLSEIQSDFSAEQITFRNNYTAYMKSLEALIATDCQTQPDTFYDQLIKVREQRSKLRTSTEKLTNLAEEQYQSVQKLQEDL